ncbi:LssY C-terminal domain-containing protein (plasmid) [Burkholderia contaminans]|nr:LssY C-terminal domain-containing protein [Burkholderia contaminans]UMY33502.1 LssY C-terminal domain-containing protein [Burkholderia contaminans]
MHAWLVSISNHPNLVMAVVFAAACAESVAVIGTVVPAGIIMFVAGALIGAGALNGWLTLGVAALGAVIGDGLSYELGRRFHSEVRSWWQARGHEGVWVRGEQFVQRHGGKSIVLARFFAPVRAVVPLVVGAARMGRLSFYPTNIASALAWAPAHIAPGIVFGASAALAEAVSARLAVMLILFVALLWLVVRIVRLVIRFGLPIARRIAHRALLRLARRFPRFGRHVLRTIGTEDPEFATLAALAFLLIASVWLFAGVLQDVIANDPLMQADTALFALLKSLRTAPVDAAMTALSVLNSYAVGLIVAAVVLVWLVLQKSWGTAAAWIIVVGVAAVLAPVVGATSNGAWPSGWQPGTPHSPLPDGQAAFSLLVYTFLGWVLARRQRAPWRAGVATAVSIWIVLDGFADLYLGRAWLSGLLGGWSLGLAWLAMLAGAYTYWRVRDDVRPRALALLVVGILTIAGAWTISRHVQPIPVTLHDGRPTASLTFEQWLDTGWQQLPARRTEIGGDEEEPLPLQWPASDETIVRTLEKGGWQPAPAWSVRSILGWLLPQTQADQLPVLPRYSQGESPRIAMIHSDPNAPAGRLVVRLWRSHIIVGDENGNASIWYGALYRETLYRPVHLITLTTTHNIDSPSTIATLLAVPEQAVIRSRTAGGIARYAVLVLPAALGASPVNVPERK